jgi:hypothetical protein
MTAGWKREGSDSENDPDVDIVLGRSRPVEVSVAECDWHGHRPEVCTSGDPCTTVPHQ